MSEAHIDDHTLPRKINIGCGFDIRPGYLNVDSGDWHNPDLIADVTGMPMLPSGHFEEAVAQDVLEHIERTKQVTTLSEWSRLLCQGGLLHVRVPSVVDMVRMLEQPDFRDSVQQQHFWVQMLYGTQAYPGDFHLCGYTCATLADLGRQAGLFLSSLAIKDRWLFDATFRKVHGIDDLTNREFVVHQYVTVLERVPDIGGLTHWISRIDEGAASRAEITRAFQSARFKES
jgi:predicted SAM-dependent methyltransferase